jgi:hypothetical protein
MFKLGYEELYRIRYTPLDGYVGLDTIISKVTIRSDGNIKPQFEGYIIQTSGILTIDDHFVCDVSDENKIFFPLENDSPQEKNLAITDITFIDNGRVIIDPTGKHIIFDPIKPGYAFINYLACSELGDCLNGAIQIRVDDQTRKIGSDSCFYQTLKNKPISFIIPPGFLLPASYYYLGNLESINNQVYKYTPREGFCGKEIIPFQKLIDGKMYNHFSVIQVLDLFSANGWTNDDHVFTEVDNPLIIAPLINDFGAEIKAIVTEDLAGTADLIGDSLCLFTPHDGFEGHTYFKYVICKESFCDTGLVNIVVHDFRPSVATIHLQTLKDQNLEISQNLPIDDYYFHVVMAPRHGDVIIGPEYKNVVYQPTPGYIGLDTFLVEYCTVNVGHSRCKTVEIKMEILDGNISHVCNSECVWPGDVNSDGMVNAVDLLPLGLNMGVMGPPRRETHPLPWYGRAGDNWTNSMVFAVNDLKHADTDGNGFISVSDTVNIIEFYHRAHSIPHQAAPRIGNFPFELELMNEQVDAGDMAIVEFSAGAGILPTFGMAGLSFTLVVDGGSVDSSSFKLFIQNSWFNQTSGILKLSKSIRNNQLDVGLVRTNKKWVTGQGPIGQIKFIVEEDLNGFRSNGRDKEVVVRATNITAMDIMGNFIILPDVQTKFRLFSPSQIPSSKMDLFPNPAKDHIRIRLPLDQQFENIKLIDSFGRMVSTIPITMKSNTKLVHTAHLIPGIYFIEVVTSEGKILTEKLMMH